MTPAAGLFSAADWQYLTGPLQLIEAAGVDHPTLSVADFTDPARCRLLLDELGPVIGAPSRRITASLLSKRLAFLITGASLYALSACNRTLDMSADNCRIDPSHDGRRWTSCLPLHRLEAQAWPADQRDHARGVLVDQVFAGLIAPLWAVLHQVSGVPMRMLWENTAVRVYSLYERRMADFTEPASIARRDADWHFLIDAPAALFGWSANPLARFLYAPTRRANGDTVRFRRTCCLYFKATQPPVYCRTCPLLTIADKHGCEPGTAKQR
ncbi:IucA/IucC family C-terminal-domain containing protein [Salinisphaera sp. T31B1]|uniref:IucA/IucC family C-terminal-domain containing protein n=1 Tax=Salinisphaera sp. T31B1 TaxID=727963 RepID=UPI00333FC1FF